MREARGNSLLGQVTVCEREMQTGFSLLALRALGLREYSVVEAPSQSNRSQWHTYTDPVRENATLMVPALTVLYTVGFLSLSLRYVRLQRA